ncbi:hypothetical protein DFR58_115103 [Anaerobacterium chartisolvens]|uniref:Uncharacterized protein n=1 Tax=Anaerobacterium chartisolvens TaxID=1297424 RepID=A0A369AYM7_9FIRM|nr:hypothetical protein DFR58_115103 [Anaerobacterium chartisolvens]
MTASLCPLAIPSMRVCTGCFLKFNKALKHDEVTFKPLTFQIGIVEGVIYIPKHDHSFQSTVKLKVAYISVTLFHRCRYDCSFIVEKNNKINNKLHIYFIVVCYEI